MAGSANITVTNHRLRKAMANLNDDDFTRQSKKLSDKLKSELQLNIGKVIEICADTETATVQINGSSKKKTCLIAHDIFSEGMNINGFPKGNTSIRHKQHYITPSDTLYGVIVTVKDEDEEKNVLLSFVNRKKWNNNDIAKAGEYRMQVGDNVISITDQYINIKSDNLVVNGLPYTEANTPLENYYDKTETDTAIADKVNDITIDLTSLTERIEQLENPSDVYEDTGWENATMETGWTAYDSGSTLQYRRYGKVVEVKGLVKPTATINGTSFEVATISDTSCRPSSTRRWYCTGFTNYHFVASVSSSGKIQIDRFYSGNTSQSSVTTNQVFIINGTYLVD